MSRPAAVVVLELHCSRCGTGLVQYRAELARDLDEQLGRTAAGARYPVPISNGPGVLPVETLGGYRRGSDGHWYRWQPDDREPLADGEVRVRVRPRCPLGCLGPDVQYRQDDLDADVIFLLRRLHEHGRPTVMRMTFDMAARRATRGQRDA